MRFEKIAVALFSLALCTSGAHAEDLRDCPRSVYGHGVAKTLSNASYEAKDEARSQCSAPCPNFNIGTVDCVEGSGEWDCYVDGECEGNFRESGASRWQRFHVTSRAAKPQEALQIVTAKAQALCDESYPLVDSLQISCEQQTGESKLYECQADGRCAKALPQAPGR